ncbi:response regulator transcription factor [Nocardia otitidiscaviarum]|uniref:response regulator transcription factor n=1 Tax=Nocardia otitidiscaviarum TaxID=1823 RepID=UPI002453819C|nr:response regulator transcription factor [Nocardia otitidiscaviarum]
MSDAELIRVLVADDEPLVRAGVTGILGTDPGIAVVAEAVHLAADGFVLKSGDPRELILGVHAVATGGAFFSPAIARRLLDSRRTTRFHRIVAARRRFAALTPREQEILRLVGLGWSNAEIAAELYLVSGTVKVHMSSILRTTGARNRVEAALIAVHADALDMGDEAPQRNW